MYAKAKNVHGSEMRQPFGLFPWLSMTCMHPAYQAPTTISNNQHWSHLESELIHLNKNPSQWHQAESYTVKKTIWHILTWQVFLPPSRHQQSAVCCGWHEVLSNQCWSVHSLWGTIQPVPALPSAKWHSTSASVDRAVCHTKKAAPRYTLRPINSVTLLSVQ